VNLKNKFEKVGIFLTPRNKRQTHHVYHAIHHNFTTQKPPLRATFCKTTLKSISKSGAFPRVTTPTFFPEN
jgi:hypothetical protein